MKHELLVIGKVKDEFIAAGIQEYASRLIHYTGFSITCLKERAKSKRKAVAGDQEGSLLLEAVSAGAIKVILDPRGVQISSEQLAEKIRQWENQAVKHICYLIGGPEGHSPNTLAAADFKLSLSKMTFTHDMARMLLVEQLYRAYTINAGEKYHK